MFLNNWFGHIIRKNILLHGVVEGEMTEVKGEGIRRAQLPDDLKTEGYIGSYRRNLKIEKGGKDSLSYKRKDQL